MPAGFLGMHDLYYNELIPDDKLSTYYQVGDVLELPAFEPDNQGRPAPTGPVEQYYVTDVQHGERHEDPLGKMVMPVSLPWINCPLCLTSET